MRLTLLMLPGLHGGSKLFERFVAALPDWISPLLVTYPNDRIVTYDEILAQVRLPDEPFALLAESYAGPLGIRIAASQPAHLRALIFVATFARSPHPWAPRWAAGIVRGWMFRLPIQKHAVRRILLSDDGPPDQLDEGWRALFLCDTNVLAGRVREVHCIDVRPQLEQIKVPTLYLQATRDRVVPAWSLRDIQKALPNTEVLRIDAPHPVLQRRAAKSAAAVADFLQRIR